MSDEYVDLCKNWIWSKRYGKPIVKVSEPLRRGGDPRDAYSRMNDRRYYSSEESDGELRCYESMPKFSSDSDDESARVDASLPSNVCESVVKEDARWNLATHHLRRETGARTARERAWIETTMANSVRAKDYMRCLPLEYYLYYQTVDGGEKIPRLEGSREDLRRRFERVVGAGLDGGGGGSSSGVSRGFSWVEIDAAFRSRVLTGAVTNSTYIEPARFLEDAKGTVLEKVQDNLTRYSCLKLLLGSDLGEWYDRHVRDAILAALDEFQERDSGWALSRILNLTVNVNKCNPMRVDVGWRYRENDTCFARAVVAALYPVERNADRCGSYPDYATVLNLDGINLPIDLKKIGKFERQNDVSINVFTTREGIEKKAKFGRGADDNAIVPLRLTDDKRHRHVNLLYLRDTLRGVNRGHFAWIKNLSRLVNSQLTAKRCVKHVCDRCLHYFYTREKLAAHSVDCGRMNDCAIVLPNEDDKWLSFDNHDRKERLPFVVYADLECLLEQRRGRMSKGPRERKDTLINVTYRSAWATICAAPTTIPYLRTNIVAARIAFHELTENEKREFWLATHCHVCGKAFQPEDNRVRDHCHLTGRYRGPAHSRCNLNYRNVYVIPVFFHNLSGYDAHFIVEKIANDFEGGVELLPLTKESYISFAKTVKETQTDGRWIGSISYEYVDSVDKLRETELPPREVFYSSLTDETASESDYEHATRVWRRFRVRDLGEYSDLYLKTDVLLLADIFENFRDTCVVSYGLDPAHYYTLPGYTWDAMLRYTGVRFELLTDIDMVLFVERGIRGGLSQCSLRYARANNRHVPTYDSSQPTTYLMYYDVNNLYGWAMSESLPYANFQWLDDPENFDVTTVPADSDIGYILEVDLEYPPNLHDVHADLPLCPTRDKPPGKRQEKLLATLYDKSRYVTHYQNLQQCLRLGLRLTRVRGVLRFTQSPWLRGYIELNTTLRTRASNEFERNMYKLMNNAVFGKTMENVRDHVDVRLVTRWDGRYGAEAMIAKPNFHSRSVFSENLVAIELRRLEVKFNKPVYVGMCILEISKTRLYEFHYDYMSDLLLECEDAYDRMRRDIDRFDTSDYAENNAHGMPRVNKKVPGLMKDENNGAIMTEFVGLRAKMYTYKVLGRDDTKRIKGVKRNVVAKRITFEDYVACLRNARELKTRQSCIRSTLHEVYTVSEQKLALSPHDDKRYVTLNSEETLPWGHYGIPL
ncbi:uncharacterized protein [Temnothorax nylanderi]|uniref:uncharacterized protein n=1 Tax=Temnothorax nylanderi TaxID=102681 RepID=UPI003A846722